MAIRAKMHNIYHGDHFPMTGSAGFDLYADGVYRNTFRPPFDVKDGFDSRVDLNGDLVVDDGDVEVLLWHTLFPEAYPISINADLTKDGQVDDADVEFLLWHVLFPEMQPLRKPEKPDDLS